MSNKESTVGGGNVNKPECSLEAAAGSMVHTQVYLPAPVSKPQPLRGQCWGHRYVLVRQRPFTFYKEKKIKLFFLPSLFFFSEERYWLMQTDQILFSLKFCLNIFFVVICCIFEGVEKE